MDAGGQSAANPIEYEQYLQKIWIVKDWNGAYDTGGPMSFHIDEIENETIIGSFTTGELAFPLLSDDNTYYSKGSLTGAISNDIAECEISDQGGTKGTATLMFKESDEIAVTIKFTRKDIYVREGSDVICKDVVLDGNYFFRPYQLSDIKELDVHKTHSYELEIDSWGKVNLVTSVFNANKPYPVAYLINDKGDILYSFGNPFTNGTEIRDVYVEDINGDGLKDVRMNNSIAERIFLQKEDGLFHSGGI